MLRKCETDRLLDKLNAAKGKAYPEVGYSYFADIGGWGHGAGKRKVYTIINPGGGVVLSDMNALSSRGRCQRIRAELKRLGVHN